MRSFGRKHLSCLVSLALLTGVGACSSGSGNDTVGGSPSGAGGSSSNRGGSTGSSAKGGSGGGSDSGGSTGTGNGGASGGGTGGGSGTGTGSGGAPGGGSGGMTGGGAGGMTGGGGSTTPAPDGGANSTGGSGGGPDAPVSAGGNWAMWPGVPDLSIVKPTAGCGMPNTMPTGQFLPFDTMVAKPDGHDASADNGAWGDGKRRYHVRLPAGYDPMKKYKIVIAPGSCGSTGPSPVDGLVSATGANAIVIYPEVEPNVHKDGSASCYDDKNPKSIDYPFLEKFLQEVGQKFCYDQNKVFVMGHSSGGWYANMMGCVYTTTLVRGMASNGGGIASAAGAMPPCVDKPEAGYWLLSQQDGEDRQDTFSAIDRALRINKCMGGGATGAYKTAPSMAYTEGGAKNCKIYTGCPKEFPVVLCEPPGGHGQVPSFGPSSWAFMNALP